MMHSCLTKKNRHLHRDWNNAQIFAPTKARMLSSLALLSMTDSEVRAKVVMLIVYRL